MPRMGELRIFSRASVSKDAKRSHQTLTPQHQQHRDPVFVRSLTIVESNGQLHPYIRAQYAGTLLSAVCVSDVAPTQWRNRGRSIAIVCLEISPKTFFGITSTLDELGSVYAAS